MRLNALAPAEGAHRRARRVGRGPGSGRGKTCGRGTKGQGARSGDGVKIGFEGGQMPIQRRLPKYGFISRKARFAAEVRLGDLERMEAETVDLDALKEAGVVGPRAERVKIIASGEISRAVTVKGVGVTRGAREAIEAAGGRVDED